MSHTITVRISADDEVVRQFGEFQVGVMPTAVFTCYEPDDAWCRRNLFGPGEGDPSEMPNDCWFTILADGLLTWGKGGIYDGPPTELRSGEIIFTKIDEPDVHGDDFCTWHYKDDTP
jgi:hypothetical protein